MRPGVQVSTGWAKQKQWPAERVQDTGVSRRIRWPVGRGRKTIVIAVGQGKKEKGWGGKRRRLDQESWAPAGGGKGEHPRSGFRGRKKLPEVLGDRKGGLSRDLVSKRAPGKGKNRLELQN